MVGLREKYAGATWNLGETSAFVLRRVKHKRTCIEMAYTAVPSRTWRGLIDNLN
jgi:hypothetical protein